MKLWPNPFATVLEYLFLEMLQQLSYDIPISQYDTRIMVNNDLITRKSMKVIN